MAVKSSLSATRKLEDQLTCPVCLEQYDDPRTLPCLHSFCTKCLKRLPLERKRDGTYSFSCPTCRTPVNLPQQGVTAFQKSFYLNNLMELQQDLTKVQISTSKVKEICDNCKKEEATAGYCPDCDKLFCSSCNDVHKRWGPTSTHTLISAKGRVATTTMVPSVKPAAAPVLQNCPSHHKPLDLYCVTCDQLICYYCTIKGHKGHTHDLLSDVYEERKKELEQRVVSLSEKIKKIMRIKEELKANQKLIEEKEKFQLEVYQLAIETMMSVLHHSLQLSFQQMATSTQNKIKFEEQQVKTVDVHLDELQQTKEHAQHCLAEELPTQLVRINEQLTRIDDLLASNECDLIKPIEKPNEPEDDLPDSEEKLKEFASEFAKDFSSSLIGTDSHSKEFYRQCYLVPKSIPSLVQLSEESTGTFRILFQGQPVMVNKEDITCSFNTIDNVIDSVIECEVDSTIENGNELAYEIKFTADKLGDYIFKVKVDGEEIDTKQTYLKVQIILK